MIYLREPCKGVWVASRELGNELLRQRILQADVCISDLDDTDAKSPAKEIAFHDWLRRSFKDEKYRCWLWECSKAKLREGKKAERECWKEYVRLFLGTVKAREQVGRFFSSEKARDSLFPGVLELYGLLSADKYYLTRNIEQITRKYQWVLKFRGVFTEVDEKEKLMEGFILHNPKYKRYFVREDSLNYNGIDDVLRFQVSRGRIEYKVSHYVASKPQEEKHGFDVETGKDQTGLVELLREG